MAAAADPRAPPPAARAASGTAAGAVAITGAGTGIGRAAARAFYEQGASLILNGRREDVLARTAAELDPGGRRVAVSAGDIGSAATASRIAATARDRFGGLDVLVNAAGIFRPTPFASTTDAELEAYLATIVKGTFYATRAALPLLEARGGGAVVNVGSMWAAERALAPILMDLSDVNLDD